jgi:hypothetical protein
MKMLLPLLLITSYNKHVRITDNIELHKKSGVDSNGLCYIQTTWGLLDK